MTLVLRGGGVTTEPTSFTLQLHALRGLDPIMLRGEEVPTSETTLIPTGIDDSAIGDPVLTLAVYPMIPGGLPSDEAFGDPYITLGMRPDGIDDPEFDVGAPLVSTDGQVLILRRMAGGGILRRTVNPGSVLRSNNLFTQTVMPDAFFPEHETLSNPLETDFGMPDALIVSGGAADVVDITFLVVAYSPVIAIGGSLEQVAGAGTYVRAVPVRGSYAPSVGRVSTYSPSIAESGTNDPVIQLEASPS